VVATERTLADGGAFWHHARLARRPDRGSRLTVASRTHPATSTGRDFMTRRFRLGMALVLALGVVLAGCGGGGGSTSDPASTVKAVADAMQAKQWDKIADYACADKKDEISKQFNFAESLGGSMPGVDTKKFSDALNIKFSNLEVKEESRTGDKAVVSMKGKLDVTIEPGMLKDLVREALKASGQTDVTDAVIEAAMGTMGDQFNFSQDMDEKVNVVNEGGKWLMCE
jgi:hypothetical protein